MNLPLNTDLTGKVAVITGAAGTLCSVFSRALAACGAKVALLGRTYENVQKLADLRPEHFRSLYAKLRKQKNKANGKPLSEATVEGVHSCLCGILSDAMEGGYIDHNPAWRTYKYAGQKKEKKIADDETVKKLIQALESVSILHETYFKLIIATGMRRGECCALKWEDINSAERSIHVCRNAVKTTGGGIIASLVRPTQFERATYRVGVL